MTSVVASSDPNPSFNWRRREFSSREKVQPLLLQQWVVLVLVLLSSFL